MSTEHELESEFLGPTNPSPKASAWMLAIAACAGLGVGVGASFAVGRAGSREAAPLSGPSASGLTQGPGDSAAVKTQTPADSAGNAPQVPTASAAQAGAVQPADVVAAAPDTEAARPDQSAALDALLAELKATHGRLHASAEAADVERAITSALDEVFAKQKVRRRFGVEFYAAFGLGRFVRSGALTPLGEGVLAQVAAIEAHAISAEPYDREALLAATANLGRATAGTGSPVAQDGGPAGSTLRGLLEAPSFDANEARERLLALPSLPPLELIGSAAASLAGQRAPTAADAPGDARVFAAFLQLALDFRFVHKAGPQVIRTADAVFDKERKELKDFIGAVLAEPGAAGLAQLIPPHPQYARMVEVLAEYRAIAERGDCEKLASGWRFRAGSKGEEVKKLQRRLTCQGFYQGEVTGQFDEATMAAVKEFQAHHDLPVEGNVLEETMEALNVPLERRVKQIELALQRMREGRFERMTDYFIRVNIPSFLLKVFENGQVVREQRVIVGTNKLDDDKVQLLQGHINRTKIFGTRLYQVIVNPTWILPKRVEEGELQSSLEKDEGYLEKTNIKKVKLGSGTEVFVQGAGEGNVLGKVKFLLEESNAIYLHDTDKRHLFKKQRRDFSHGCMRVDQAVDFAKWLLARDGYDAEEVDKAFSLKSLQRGFDMRKPVSLVTEYITVDLAADGRPVFYSDIYGYDAAYWNDNLPPLERIRWGHSRLRPRWVPLMDDKVVDGWRASGKPAPRNLGPDGKPKKDVKGGEAEIDAGP